MRPHRGITIRQVWNLNAKRQFPVNPRQSLGPRKRVCVRGTGTGTHRGMADIHPVQDIRWHAHVYFQAPSLEQYVSEPEDGLRAHGGVLDHATGILRYSRGEEGGGSQFSCKGCFDLPSGCGRRVFVPEI